MRLLSTGEPEDRVMGAGEGALVKGGWVRAPAHPGRVAPGRPSPTTTATPAPQRRREERSEERGLSISSETPPRPPGLQRGEMSPVCFPECEEYLPPPRGGVRTLERGAPLAVSSSLSCVLEKCWELDSEPKSGDRRPSSRGKSETRPEFRAPRLLRMIVNRHRGEGAAEERSRKRARQVARRVGFKTPSALSSSSVCERGAGEGARG